MKIAPVVIDRGYYWFMADIKAMTQYSSITRLGNTYSSLGEWLVSKEVQGALHEGGVVSSDISRMSLENLADTLVAFKREAKKIRRFKYAFISQTLEDSYTFMDETTLANDLDIGNSRFPTIVIRTTKPAPRKALYRKKISLPYSELKSFSSVYEIFPSNQGFVRDIEFFLKRRA